MWECPKCHERHEDSFAVCWNCGTSNEGVEDPDFAKVEEGGQALGPDARSIVDDLSFARAEDSEKSSAPQASEDKLMDLKCAKCGSTKIVPLASVMDQGQYSDGALKAYVYSNPEAWVFKGTVYGRLRAKVCGECGYTELYTTNAQELYEAYRTTST